MKHLSSDSDLPLFRELRPELPEREDLDAATSALLEAWDSADDVREQLELIGRWDRAHLELDSSRAVARIRFCQDTGSAERVGDYSAFEDLDTEISAADRRFLERVVSSPHRAALEEELGAHAFSLWEQRLTTFDPVVAKGLEAEAGPRRRYEELLASLQIEAIGKLWTTAEARTLAEDRDRAVRLAARQGLDRAFGEHRAELDELYDELVRVRHEMAAELGYSSFTPLAYRRLARVDYEAEDVRRFRAQIRDHVVPLAAEVRARHARALGLTDYGFHDESVRDTRGSPRPQGDTGWIQDHVQEVFERVNPGFGAFFARMRERGYVDLETRAGRANGAFLEALPSLGTPFIFANFTGSKDDVFALLHEGGHALQFWYARDQRLRDYHWPSNEACEVASIGMELLAHPYLDSLFGEDARRARQGHLEEAVVYLCWDTAIDELQHLVYAEPGLTPDQRAEAWKEIEATYMPWRRYEDMPWLESGRAWQTYTLVYREPFYGIDYTLATVCALQLWRHAREDRPRALAMYRRFCRLGGSLPFTALLARVGLDSPFSPGTVRELVAELSSALRLP